MSSLLRMAYRTLWRSKRRTFITAATVALGVFLSVTFTAVGDYGYTNMINAAAKMGFGHVTIQPAGYYDRPSVTKRITAVAALQSEVGKVPGVAEVNSRIVGQAMFATASKSVGGVFFGIDPSTEKNANIFVGALIEGGLFSDTGGLGVVIGTKMAQKLNLRLGKKVVWTTADQKGEIVSEIARVSGIFKTGVAEADGGVALLPIDRVRQTLRFGPDDATLVAVFLRDQRQTGAVHEALLKKEGNPRREILTWRRTQGDLAALITIDKTSNYLFQFLVGLLIAAGILNTIMMSVLERKHEFGILLAVGMSPWRLFSMVVTETLFIGLLGLVIGVFVTVPWFYYMSTTGIDLSAFIEEGYDVGGVLVDPVMKFRLYGESVVAILAGVLGLTIAAGLYPAIKAGSLPPVESLRGV